MSGPYTRSSLLTWEKLWARFCAELRELDADLVRLLGGARNPTFEQIRFYCTTPDEHGVPWLRLPSTFDLDSPDEYFQTVLIPRKERGLNCALWSLTRQPTAKRPAPVAKPKARPKKSGGEEGPPASEEGPDTQERIGAFKLMGSRLTRDEAVRAQEHRPLDHQKKPICWDAISHAGCTRPNCSFSHPPKPPRSDALDYAVRLQLLRRGGLRSQKNGGRLLYDS